MKIEQLDEAIWAFGLQPSALTYKLLINAYCNFGDMRSLPVHAPPSTPKS